VFDLMFAAALSGMRAGEAVDQSQPQPIDYDLATTAYDRKPAQRDWRRLVRDDFNAEVKNECSIFFQKELSRFGTLKLTSACEAKGD
jgi:hypothetical protein